MRSVMIMTCFFFILFGGGDYGNYLCSLLLLCDAWYDVKLCDKNDNYEMAKSMMLIMRENYYIISHKVHHNSYIRYILLIKYENDI